MTEKQTREKLRAVFLTALMVTSVFTGTIAFAGTAAANVEALSVAGNSEVVSDTDTIWVSGQAGNTDDITFKIEDEDGDSATVKKSINNKDYTVSIDLSSLTYSGGNGDGLSDGTSVKVMADQDSSFTNPQAEDTFKVDSTGPGINAFTVTQDGADVRITVKTDEPLGSEDGDLAVKYNDADSNDNSLDRSDFTNTTSNAGGPYVYTSNQTAFAGGHSATLNTAKDALGNDGANGESDSVTVSGSPTFQNANPKDTKISDNEHKISVDITDSDGVNPDSISVQIYNASAGLVSSNTPSDAGVYYNGQTLSIYPGSDGVNTLPDGKVYINVTASDSNGNYDKTGWEFTVDSSGPQVTPGKSNNSYITTTEPTLTFDITDQHSYVNPNTVEVTIKDDSGNVLLDSATDSITGVEFDGRTLTVDSSMEGVPSLPQGGVTYTVTSADSEGNLNSTSFTYTVDSMQPQVTSVSVDDTPVNASNNGHQRDVTIEFSEPMDQTNAPSVKIDVDSDGTADTTVNPNATFGTNGYGPANTTWKGTITLPSVSADAIAEVEVTSATDKAGKSINTSVNNGTFLYDTKVPSASTNFSDTTFNGTLDLTEQFDISGENMSVTYEYNTNASGSFPAEDYKTVSSPESFDTTQFEDGDIKLKVTVADDVGNNDTASGNILLDNYDPSVSSTLSEGDLVYGDVNISEVFTVEHTDGNTITYEYNDSDNSTFKTLDASSPVFDATTDELDTTQLADGTLTFRVSVTDDAGNQVTETLNITVNNLDVRTFEAKGLNGSDSGSAEITFETNSNLTSLTVDVNSTDSYFGGEVTQTLTLDDFTRDYNATTGVVTYTATVDNRDGSYKANLVSAVGENDQKLLNSDVSSTFSIDGEDPHVIDSQIVEAEDGATYVRVEFNEPVANDLSGSEMFTVGDDRATSSTLANDMSVKGWVNVSFGTHFQTGDSSELNVSDGSFTEANHVGASANATNASDTTVVHTLELNLEEGHNVVSVPAASGGLDLTELDALTENDTVWTYDEGEWMHYTPDDNTSDFTTLEGGQGYIFVMDHSATIDVNVYNQPGGTDLTSATPGSEDVEEGWNLLGHWQEGSQTVQNGLSTIEDQDYGAVYEQTENGELSFSVATNLKPGEGYWVFVTEDDGDVYGETAYATS